MLDGNFRKSVDTVTAPIGRWLVRIGFSADVLTGSGLVFACATAWAIGAGYLYLAIVLLTLTGFHDLFDGPVAKASHRSSQRGNTCACRCLGMPAPAAWPILKPTFIPSGP